MTPLIMLFIGLVAGGALVLTISRAPAFFQVASARASATKHQQTLANINRLELELGLVEPPNAAPPRPKLLPPPGGLRPRRADDGILNSLLLTEQEVKKIRNDIAWLAAKKENRFEREQCDIVDFYGNVVARYESPPPPPPPKISGDWGPR